MSHPPIHATLALLASLVTAEAARADEADDCIAAHTEAQRLRKQGKLLGARKQLLFCGGKTCPGMLMTDCSTWLAEVETEVPSIVVALRGPAGEIADARVFIDGTPVRDRIDGQPIELEPGARRVRVEAPGEAPIEQEVVVRTGEKNRVVAFTVAREDSRALLRTLSYVAGGLGVIGLAGFAAFGLSGQIEYDELNDEKTGCAPHCSQSAEDSVRTRFLIANVSLGVGAVALGGAVVLFVLSRPQAAESPTKAGVSFGIGALPGGGAVTFRRAF